MSLGIERPSNPLLFISWPTRKRQCGSKGQRRPIDGRARGGRRLDGLLLGGYYYSLALAAPATTTDCMSSPCRPCSIAAVDDWPFIIAGLVGGESTPLYTWVWSSKVAYASGCFWPSCWNRLWEDERVNMQTQMQPIVSKLYLRAEYKQGVKVGTHGQGASAWTCYNRRGGF